MPLGKTVPLLWPVHVWAVMAPQARTHGLNLFQEGILGLLATGLRELDALAKMLDLDPQLVAFIVATQLVPRGWVDARYALTESGQEALHGQLTDQPKLSVQYVFQDAICGAWMPRLSESLPEIEPVSAAEQHPVFVLDRDSGRQERPYILGHLAQARFDRPAATAALGAFRRDLRRARLEESDFGSEALEDELDAVDGVPFQAHVWCEIFTSARDLQPWLISDPWRVSGAASWLREPLMQHVGRFTGLGGRIASLIGSSPPQGESLEDWLAGIDQGVQLEMADMPHLQHHPLIREHVARLVRQMHRLDAMPKHYQEDLSALAQESMSLLEAVLKWVLQSWKVQSDRWPSHDRVGASAFQLLPGDLGLSDAAARALGGQLAAQVKYAARFRDRPLKALLAAALLGTHQHSDHPFIALGPAGLRIDELLAFTAKRNEAAHASGSRLSAEETLAMAKFAMSWQEQFRPYY